MKRRPTTGAAKPTPTTRASIVAAAVALVREAEHAGAITVRRVVEAAGVNLNAVNYHFGSKQGLVREVVREVILDYFRAHEVPRAGTRGSGVLALTKLAAGFLFAEPIASRLALDAELEEAGAGPSLTRETLDGLAAELAAARPELSDDDVRLRVWMLVSSVHALFLRPDGAREWLAVDPRDASARDALLARLVTRSATSS
jgi:AcrR family transcriptional regulator